ncbi:MAG: sulfur oxidation c-type cytochrome SoxA [Halofilum sp. (in: g-proteobacteria)]|nr:sulfur oxidation c-type cytochrome SoxA [Halofilum sp. (in: g-proteobacteria)]
MHTTTRSLWAGKKLLLAAPILLLAVTGTASAQCANCTNEEPKEILLNLIDQIDSDYLTQSPQNLQMMDSNSAYFVVDDGKALFETKRGPNNVSLEQCDFGQGPGVLEGAYAKMPRYFEDADRVMHLESRLAYCMKTIQGFSSDADELSNRSQMRAMMAYVAARSNGYEWDPPMDHPMEKAMRDAGEVMFYRRSSTMDFSCNTCHGETGKQIRASVLPNMNRAKEWTKAVSWPAQRVGKNSVRSPYQRLRGCYWQMRKGKLNRRSDAAIAMFSFWTDAARGEPAILPDLKR